MYIEPFMLDTVGQPILSNRLRSDERKYKLTFVVFGIFIVILIANLVWVNTLVLQSRYSAASTVIATTAAPAQVVTPRPCTDCLTPTPLATQTPSNIIASVVAKDYFIPFGSGAGQSGEWEDLAGMVASVDLGQYQGVKNILFEASVSMPTANQHVTLRLYNKTDQHPVWNSEITMNNAYSYLVSAPITYDTGVKLYQVQLKTQLQFTTSISQARMHVILK